MKILLISILLLVLSGCGASISKYTRDEKTGKLIQVEKYSTSGIGKISGEFGTGGKIETDTGLKVPSIAPIGRQ